VSAVHTLPGSHFGQSVPPQSMSVSVPFLVPSVHVASATQAAPVFVYPLSHVKSHCCPLHDAWAFAGGAHAVHEPQPFVGSGATHEPPHMLCPYGHAGVPPPPDDV
jgi:hypothetical protein